MEVDNFKQMCVRQPSLKAVAQQWLITNPVSRPIGSTNDVTLNIKAGVLLSIFELCRNWQFYLTSLEGISMLEPFVLLCTAQSMLLSMQCNTINQHSFAAIQPEFAPKIPTNKQFNWSKFRSGWAGKKKK